MSATPKDVPSPIDFHDEAESRVRIEQTIRNRPYRTTFFNRFVKELRTLRDRRLDVLELGSGPGILAEEILRRCSFVSSYTLLDFSRPMLRMSRERLTKSAAQLRFVCADFRHVSLIAKVGSVDVVVSMQAIHEVRHKHHVPALYERILSVLNPGGMLLVCDHLPGENPDARRNALYMTAEEQLAALKAAGFQKPAVLFAAHEMALYRAYAPKH